MLAGFNMLLWCTHITEDQLGHCQFIKSAGYDGVEIPVFEGSLEHYRWVGQTLDDLGLRRTAVGVVQSEDANPMSSDAHSRKAGVDHLKWMVDVCAEAGVETLCGPFHQPLGVFSGAGPTELELNHLVEAHIEMAEYAKGSGVKLSVEPLNRFECYALNTLSQSSQLVERVGQPDYGCLFDTFHANIEERDIAAAIAKAGSSINHVHFSENDRGTPGKGHIDFVATANALKSIGYDGWIVLEAFSQALPDLAAATRVWRPLFESEEEVVLAGIETIREAWSAN